MNLKYVVKYISICCLVIGAISCEDSKSESPDKGDFDREALLQNIYDQQVIIEHNKFIVHCKNLEMSLTTFSEITSTENLEQAQIEWKETKLQWKRCELYDIGRVKDRYIHNRIDKWETNTSFLEENLASTDTLNVDFVINSGSTSKGLPAIEYLLFPTNDLISSQSFFEDSNIGNRRLFYLESLVKQLVVTSKELLSFWEGDLISFPQNTDNSLQGSLNQLVNQQVSLVEEVLNSKLGNPLGKSNGGLGQPLQVECPYARVSLDAIRQNIEAVHNSLTDSSGRNIYGLLDFLEAGYKDQSLSEALESQFTKVYTELDLLDQSLYILSESNTDQVEQLYLEVRELLILVKVDLTSALGISVTFNDNDGD